MFLEKLTQLFSSAFHRRPNYITVSVNEALAISQPAKALPPSRLPRHVAIIMDGNGRWAQGRGLSRSAGHAAGTEALRDIIRASDEWGIEALSLYAFSTENWARSKEEVGALMALLLKYFNSEIDELDEKNVRITILGDVDGLPEAQRQAVTSAMERTAKNTGLKLNIALNYGGRAELVRAAKLLAERARAGELEPGQIDEALFSQCLYTADSPDVDLLIRTSGEQRLSNFLPWQTSYAEFVFDTINWPDFDRTHYMKCLRIYADRDRRFGGVKNAEAESAAEAPAQPSPEPASAAPAQPAPEPAVEASAPDDDDASAEESASAYDDSPEEVLEDIPTEPEDADASSEGAIPEPASAFAAAMAEINAEVVDEVDEATATPDPEPDIDGEGPWSEPDPEPAADEDGPWSEPDPEPIADEDGPWSEPDPEPIVNEDGPWSEPDPEPIADEDGPWSEPDPEPAVDEGGPWSEPDPEPVSVDGDVGIVPPDPIPARRPVEPDDEDDWEGVEIVNDDNPDSIEYVN